MPTNKLDSNPLRRSAETHPLALRSSPSHVFGLRDQVRLEPLHDEIPQPEKSGTLGLWELI